jgi:hypothetical protein
MKELKSAGVFDFFVVQSSVHKLGLNRYSKKKEWIVNPEIIPYILRTDANFYLVRRVL